MKIISQQLLTLLFNSLWQIALIAAVATLSARLLRAAKAGTRHLLWVAALVAPVCLAAIAFSLGAKHETLALIPLPTEKTEITALARTNAIQAMRLPESAPTKNLPAPIPESSIPVGRSFAIGLLAAYLLLVAYRSAQLLRAWLKTRAIVRDASEAELPAHIQAIVQRCLETIGIVKARLLWSPSISVPVTIGALRPVVILPEEMLGERDADLLTTALGHELAHVRRHDYALNLFYELLYLPISFHPAAAWVKRRIRQTREQRCDELVTEKLMNGAAYARSLVKMASWASPMNSSTPTISVGIADAGNLEERVMSILRKPRISTRRKSLSIAAASLLFAIPCIAAAPHILRISISATEATAAPAPNLASASNPFAQQDGDRQRETSKESRENRENPICRECPNPRYAKDARAKKIGGEVQLEATIGTDGIPREIKVTKSLYPSLDESAMNTVREWRFEPAMKDGKAIEKRVPIHVSFNVIDGDGDADNRDADRVRLEFEARENAKQAMRENQEREMKDRDKRKLETEQLDRDQALRALQEQIENLERELDGAKAAHDTDAAKRGEDVLKSLREKLAAKERETVERSEWQEQKEKEAKDKDKEKHERGDADERKEKEAKDKEKRERGLLEYRQGYFVYDGADGKANIEELNRSQAELAKLAKITMSQAIEIALKKQPGTALSCELRKERDQVFYVVMVLTSDKEHAERAEIQVNAIDGSTLNSEKREQ
jgi:TonB family protein